MSAPWTECSAHTPAGLWEELGKSRATEGRRVERKASPAEVSMLPTCWQGLRELPEGAAAEGAGELGGMWCVLWGLDAASLVVWELRTPNGRMRKTGLMEASEPSSHPWIPCNPQKPPGQEGSLSECSRIMLSRMVAIRHMWLVHIWYLETLCCFLPHLDLEMLLLIFLGTW